jgi:hypothetical protein
MRAHDGRSPNSILTNFDLTIIEHQPLDLANHVFDDFLRQFKPTHQIESSLAEPNTFFQIGYPAANVKLVSNSQATTAIDDYFGGPPLSANVALDRVLRDYQKVVFTWGPLLAVLEFLGLLAILGVGKARSSGRRAECLVLWSSGILVFFFSVASFEFSFRYLLPTIFFVPPASVLAVAMIWPRFRTNTWSRRGANEFPQRAESDSLVDLPLSKPSPRSRQPVDA